MLSANIPVAGNAMQHALEIRVSRFGIHEYYLDNELILRKWVFRESKTTIERPDIRIEMVVGVANAMGREISGEVRANGKVISTDAFISLSSQWKAQDTATLAGISDPSPTKKLASKALAWVVIFFIAFVAISALLRNAA